MANEENLQPRPPFTLEEAQAFGRKGGKKSAAAKRERKLMSQIYAEFLAREHDIVINGQPRKLSGDKMVAHVLSKVLSKGGAPSVSMMREIREATEGSFSKVENTVKIDMNDPATQVVLKKHGIVSKD